MAVDHRTGGSAMLPNAETGSLTTGADGVGTRVTAPRDARMVILESTAAFRVSLDAADAATLTTANSRAFAAGSHTVWLQGVSPGNRGRSKDPAYTIGSDGAATQVVTVEYRS